jgi:DNA-binding NarL/FixJ family response regulator
MRRVVALSAAAAVAEPIELLTCREEEVAQLLLVGLSNKEIAQRLTIEVATVKNHVHNILGKLHARRRGEAVALMQGHGEALVALEGGSNDLDP